MFTVVAWVILQLGEELPALVSSLLFTVHPVHVEVTRLSISNNTNRVEHLQEMPANCPWSVHLVSSRYAVAPPPAVSYMHFVSFWREPLGCILSVKQKDSISSPCLPKDRKFQECLRPSTYFVGCYIFDTCRFRKTLFSRTTCAAIWKLCYSSLFLLMDLSLCDKRHTLSTQQAVAPIVGRADLLCGFFAVLALSLIVRDRSSTANDRSVLHDRRNRRDSSLSPVGWDKKRDRKAQTVGKNKTKRKKKRERRAIARSKTMARTGAAVKAGDGCTAVSVMRQTSLGTELMTITCQDKFNGKDEEDGGDLDDRKDGTVARSPRWPTRGPTAPRAGNSEAFSTVTAAVAVEKSGNCGGGGDGGGDAGGGTVILETPAADPQQTTANLISASSRLTSADLPTEESVVELSPTSSRLHRATGGERVHPSSRRSTKRNPAPSTTVTRKWGLCSGRDNNVVVLGSGPGVVRFAAALGLAAAATLCKEVGVTVYLLIAGAELVRFLERAVFGVSKAGAVASGVGSGRCIGTVANRLKLRDSIACAIMLTT